MELKLKHAILFTILGMFIIAGILWAGGWFNQGIKMKGAAGYTTSVTFLNATTTTATSTNAVPQGGYADITNAEKVTFKFKRTGANGNAGSSRFSVEVSEDLTNWFDYTNLTSASSSESKAYGYYTISGTTTDFLSMSLTDDAFNYVRVIVDEATDGEHSAEANIEY